jgi:hypothetical protein
MVIIGKPYQLCSEHRSLGQIERLPHDLTRSLKRSHFSASGRQVRQV